jgi:hypothetical protein
MAEDETRETQDQETEPGESSSASRGWSKGTAYQIRVYGFTYWSCRAVPFPQLTANLGQR